MAVGTITTRLVDRTPAPLLGPVSILDPIISLSWSPVLFP
jgi:hypothetical protein